MTNGSFDGNSVSCFVLLFLFCFSKEIGKSLETITNNYSLYEKEELTVGDKHKAVACSSVERKQRCRPVTSETQKASFNEGP